MICSEWRLHTFGEIVDTNKYSYSLQDKWQFVNYLDTGNITENKIREIQNIILGKDELPSRARRKVQAQDIVYSTVRPNQKHFGLIREPLDNMLVSTGFSVISAKINIADSGFIYWYLTQQPIVDLLHTIGEHSTSTYPAIKPSDIESLELMLPPLPEQRAIARILSSLDDKIELNNRMNKTLEDIAQTLFKRWFVDFEFPDENGMPYKSSGGAMVESEQGIIPAGWTSMNVGKIIDDYVGGDWGKDDPDDTCSEPALCVRGADFPGISSGSTSSIPTRYLKPASISRRRLKDSDVVLEISGGTKDRPVGRTVFISQGLLDSCKNPLVFSNFCRLVRFRPEIALMAFLYIQYKYSDGEIEKFQVQSTGLANFQFGKFIEHFLVVVPPPDILVKFNSISYSLIDSINTNGNFMLAQLRDTLLPKLMSGEIRVPLTEA